MTPTPPNSFDSLDFYTVRYNNRDKMFYPYTVLKKMGLYVELRRTGNRKTLITTPEVYGAVMIYRNSYTGFGVPLDQYLEKALGAPPQQKPPCAPK